MERMETIRNRKKPGEEGYTLLAVIFLLFLLTLSLSIAAPRVARDIQMDRERETVHRGLQYRRAIQLYYRKFHAYPPNLDALVKTNDIRFLRKKYVDLTTGKAEWKPILFGQAKTPTLGFFGQALAGSASSIAGVGPTGGNSSTTGSSSVFGSSSTSSTDTSSSTSGSTSGSSTSTGSAFGGSSSTGSAFGNSSSTGSSTSSSSNGQTFGGAGIIGFEPMGTRQSILIWKKKNHYNEWEFVYDPLSDQKAITSNSSSTGTSAASTSNAIGSSGSGSSSSGSTFGSSSSSGTTSNSSQ
jgi:type II secretory pathway pseudopilin PulG